MDRVSVHSTPGEMLLSSRVHLTGVIHVPEWKDGFDQARHERTLEAVGSMPSLGGARRSHDRPIGGSRRYQQKIFGKRDSDEITAGRQNRLHPEKQHVLLYVASYAERDVTVL